MRTTPLTISCLLAGALALSACGGDEGGDAAQTAEDGVQMGPGVTADTITLGVLTDTSGPFKDFSATLQGGHDLWVEDVNAAGGICGRQVELERRDHGYKADQAKIFFPEVEPNVAGFLELLGSPMIAALKSDIAAEEVSTLALSWSSELLDQEHLLIVGATYDLEIINGLAYFLDEGLIAAGDTIGHIYIEGEYGGNGLLGSQYMAEQHDLELVEAKVTSTDTDLKGIVTGFEGEGVDAIVLTTTPAQTASAASTNAALGLDVPMLGNNPVFYPTLLDTPAAPALEDLYIAASAVPYASDVTKAQEIARAYEAEYDEPPSFTAQFGYANGVIWEQILQQACEAEDLSREGIFNALQNSDQIDTEELTPDLDFSQPGAPSSREVYVAKVNADTPGGMEQVQPLFVSPDAEAYQTPHEGG